MFNDFGAVNQIERLLSQIFEELSIRSQNFKSTCRAAFSRNPNTCFSEIDSHHRVPKLSELKSYGAIPAADIEDSRVRREIDGQS